MKTWGFFVVMLTASCVWSVCFGESVLHTIVPTGEPLVLSFDAISADGTTVVGCGRYPPLWEPFRWNPNNSTEPFKVLLSKQGAVSTGGRAHDVSGDGRVIVGEGNWEGSTLVYPKIWIDDVAVEYDINIGSGVAHSVSDDGTRIAMLDYFNTGIFNVLIQHLWDYSTDPNPAEPFSNYFPMPEWNETDPDWGLKFIGSYDRSELSGDGNVLVGASRVYNPPYATRWYIPQGETAWAVHAFESESKAEGTRATGTTYDGSLVVGNTAKLVGTAKSHDWKDRGFLWPRASRFVWAWGAYDESQDTVPTNSLHWVVDLSAGSAHSAAVNEDGTVVVWGDGADPALQPPGDLGPVEHLDSGANHIVAMMADGSLRAWGNNEFGQTDIPSELSLVQIDILEVDAGLYHNLVLKADGTVIAWGKNDEGQCDVPENLSGVIDVAAGYGHSVALKGDGTFELWGANNYGQTDQPGLTLVNPVSVEAGFYHNLVLMQDGTVYAWGKNDMGQADWFYIDEPDDDDDAVAAMAGGLEHSVIRYEDGNIMVLGYMLGDETPGWLDSVTAIAAGENHVVVVEETEILYLDPRNPDHETTMAHNISGDGQTIVGTSTDLDTNTFEGLYWDNEGNAYPITDKLDQLGVSYDGWTKMNATAVNHDGTALAGAGTYGGETQYWHASGPATPPPGPVDDFIEETEAEDLGNGYHKVSWYGLIRRMEQSIHWHVEHGFQYIGDGKKDDLKIYDYGLGCWSWTSEKDYPFIYVYCIDDGWYWYKEGSDPGNREFWSPLEGKWIVESELRGG
jgi:uncharacterized membrane protein